MIPDPVVVQFIFVCICLGLLAAPFIPAWREWRHPTDDEALDVSVNLTSDTAYLALQFRNRMIALLANKGPAAYDRIEDLEQAGASASASHGVRPVVVSGIAYKKLAVDWRRPIYAIGDLHLGDRSILVAAFSEGDMVVGRQSRISGWAHSQRALTLGQGCGAAGRLSSARSIRLDHACCFERIHAPITYFGDAIRHSRPALPVSRVPLSPDRIPGAIAWGASGWRVAGDCVIPAGCNFVGALVVTGVLTLERNALVEGDVKAHKGIVIGPHACITGAVTCQSEVQVLEGASVGGPLVSEGNLLIQGNAMLGSPLNLTTVSADSIIVEQGVVAHGTVWARHVGIVMEAG